MKTGPPRPCSPAVRRRRNAGAAFLSRLTPGDVIPARVTHLEPVRRVCGCGLRRGGAAADRRHLRFAHRSPAGAVRPRHGYPHSGTRRGRDAHHALAQGAARHVGGKCRPVPRRGNGGRHRAQRGAITGVFVELAPNLAGLAESHEGAQAGMQASVFIKSILPARMKIKLILIRQLPCTRGSSHPRAIISAAATWIASSIPRRNAASWSSRISPCHRTAHASRRNP